MKKIFIWLLIILRLNDIILLVKKKKKLINNDIWLRFKTQLSIIKKNNNRCGFTVEKKKKTESVLTKYLDIHFIIKELNYLEKTKYLNFIAYNKEKTKLISSYNKELFFFFILTPIFSSSPVDFIKFIVPRKKKQLYTIYNIFILYYQPFCSLENFNFELLHTKDNNFLSNFISIYYYDFYFDKLFQNYKLSFANLLDDNNCLNFYKYYNNFFNINIDNFFLFLQTLYIKKNLLKSIQYIEINFFNKKFLIIFFELLLKNYYNSINYDKSFFFFFNMIVKYKKIFY
jgi:hypothetical protein